MRARTKSTCQASRFWTIQKIPLLIDHFPYAATYQSFQLYQRGVRWETLQNALPHRFSRGLRELLDEWTIGFELGSSVEEQTERELIAKLADPSIQYLDYFTGDFDHVAHAASDPESQRLALQRIDALIGRVWTAIESSALASQTVLVVVSDHGMNTHPASIARATIWCSFSTAAQAARITWLPTGIRWMSSS